MHLCLAAAARLQSYVLLKNTHVVILDWAHAKNSRTRAGPITVTIRPEASTNYSLQCLQKCAKVGEL